MANSQQELNELNSGFNSLRDSVKGLSKEFPEFAGGMQAGLIAISKELPGVVENMVKFNKANKELVANGEKPKSILSQLAGSMFSWNTALSIGTTLLITYGGEIVNWFINLVKGETKLSAFAKAMKDANIVSQALVETKLRANKAAQTEITDLNLLYKASQDRNLSDEKRKAAVHALQQQWPDTFKKYKDEIILTGKVTKAYNDLKNELKELAYVEAAKNKMVENSSRVLDNEQKIINERRENLKLLKQQHASEENIRKLQKDIDRPKYKSKNDVEGVKLREKIRKENDNLTDVLNKRKASDNKIYAFFTDNELLNSSNSKLATDVEKIIEKRGVSVLNPKQNNNTVNSSTVITPPSQNPPKKDSTPKHEKQVETVANEAIQILQTYTNSIEQTNIYYDQLREKHKSSAEELKQIEKARTVALLQIQNKFQSEDKQQLAQYKHEFNQIAIDNTEDAKQKALLQIQEDKNQKIEQMDQEMEMVKAKIIFENLQLIELKKKGSSDDIKILEDSIKLQQDILQKAGDVRLAFEKQQKEKEQAIRDGKDPGASAEKKPDDKSTTNNQKPEEDPAIAKIREQQKNWAHEKELAIQAAKEKGQSVFDVEAKFAVMKVNLEAQLINAKMHKADGFIDAVLKNTKKESAIYKAAFIAKKATAISDTIVTTSEAVMKSFGAYSGIPFIGQALGIAQAAFMAAQGATSIANIVKQKPGMARGGQFISDGRGAVLPGYSRTDNTNAYLRSGEAVVVSEAMRNPWARNLVSAINVAHGGRDFSVPNAGRGYAIGGIFTDGGNANRYYSAPVNDQKDLANTLAYQMINNFPPIYVDVKDVNNQQNILAQTVDRVNL